MTEIFDTQNSREQAPAQREGNFNDEVLVKITPTGEAIWHDFHAAARAFMVNNGHQDPYVITRDEDGYTRMQLWKVASIFGDSLSWGGPEPIEMRFKYINT